MKKEGAIGLLLIAVIVVVAILFLRPKDLSVALGDGFAPEAVTAISATLSPVTTGGEEITLDFPAGEETFGQLLALLQEPSYSRTFTSDEQIALGYQVYLSFATGEAWAWSYQFPGSKLIQAGPTDQTKTYQISGGQATQERILDFLLAQR